MDSLRVYVVEDDPRLREHLEVLLRGEPHITLVGVAESAERALSELDDALPDVILCDVGLPGMSGIDLMHAVRAREMGAEIMAFTVFDDRDTVLAALKAGATSYLLKGATPREIIEALFALRDGGAPMSPKIARAVIRELRNETRLEPDLLSSREREVLKSLGEGLTYKEVANRLGISAHTVHTHIKHTYEKLHAQNKQDALTKARRKGLL